MTESNNQFRSVLRGYDAAQVDQRVRELVQAAGEARREAGELTIQVSKLEIDRVQLKNQAAGHAGRALALEEAQKKAAAPTYMDLGERIGAILTIADEEANELRTRARSDAESHHALADESARATREDAQDYAREARSAADSEATRVMEDAKRRADSLLDDADRQATARREEAEAVYERARAKSSAAAADFETTLATRREKSAQEFAVQLAAAEQQLAAVQLRSQQTLADSDRAQQEATSKSAHELEQARTQAQTLVAEAKTKAERIHTESERELAAATQRRDSINAQLTNVRQMFATLSGGAMANPLPLAETGGDNTEDTAAVKPQQVATATDKPQQVATADKPQQVAAATDKPQQVAAAGATKAQQVVTTAVTAAKAPQVPAAGANPEDVVAHARGDHKSAPEEGKRVGEQAAPSKTRKS
jgi:hypothetical protein